MVQPWLTNQISSEPPLIILFRFKVNPIVKILVITMVQIQTAFDIEWEMFHGCPGCQIIFIFMVVMVSLHSKPKNTILVPSNQECYITKLSEVVKWPEIHRNFPRVRIFSRKPRTFSPWFRNFSMILDVTIQGNSVRFAHDHIEQPTSASKCWKVSSE